MGAIPLGSGTYFFASLKSIKSGSDRGVELSDDTFSIKSKVNAWLHVSKDPEIKRLDYTVQFNLNGIITIALEQENDKGWSMTDYKCVNLKNREPLSFEDIFKSEAKIKVTNLLVQKAKDECPEQLDAEYTIEDINFEQHPPIVTREGISFVSPCGRSSGHYLGVFTTDFSFHKMTPYLLEGQ